MFFEIKICILAIYFMAVCGDPVKIEKGESAAGKVQPGQKEAYVIGGSIVAFSEAVPQQARDDVKNGTLLAQLAANKKHDRTTDAEDWYIYYANVLGNIGFVFQAFQFSQIVKKTSFTMEEIVAEDLIKMTTPNALQVTGLAMNALSKVSKKDRSLGIFLDQSSEQSKNGSFQILACDAAENGDIEIGIAVLYFQGKSYNPRFLWTPYESTKITLFNGNQATVLNEQVYAKSRESIVTKLGEKGDKLSGWIQL